MTEGDGERDRGPKRGLETRPEPEAATVDLPPVGGSAGPAAGLPPAAAAPSERYRLEGQLGEGGMAVVRSARDLELDRPVAVKCLRPELEGLGSAPERFVDEARIVAGLDHPGVVPVFDLGRLPDGALFYAMKRVQGETLRRQLAARGDAEVTDRSSLQHFVDLFERVCRTVAAAHREGVIHRDLKPDNVMVDHRGEVYVMDWGLAKRLPTTPAEDSAGRTRFGAVLGTPAYMAPEQARGSAHEASRGTDVFALGVVLYEILTGANPFASTEAGRSMEGVLHHQPDDPRRLNPGVPRPLAAVCMKALEKDPFRRYPSAVELADDLRRHREHLPVSAYRPGAAERAVAWLRRHPVAGGALATAAVMLVLAGAWLGVQASVENAMVARVYGRMDQARAEASRLDAEIGRLEARRAAAESPAERAELEKAASHLAARREAQVRFADSLAIAVLGFTMLAPDSRAEQVLREDLLDGIERHLAAGEHDRAEVMLRFALITAEGNNILELTPAEVGRLRARLMALEAAPAAPRPGGE